MKSISMFSSILLAKLISTVNAINKDIKLNIVLNAMMLNL